MTKESLTSQVMKTLAVYCLLATSLLGQTVGSKENPTAAAGESWLNHLHRGLDETSMGKTGMLGPPTLVTGEPASVRPTAAQSTRQAITLHGSDLYRLNCRGCHGEFGLGVPPEINSVINPTRATSAAVVMERMKSRGMDMSRADAAQLANQSKAALLERLHQGGTDMPPFPHLSGPEIRAIFAYLRELAEIPGAEKQRVTLEESPIRVGEHVVKSTCHICHDASGPNPGPEQLLAGAIPPLSTLTSRTTLPAFVQKVRHGSPILMGTPLAPYRGRMPVFHYLSDEEASAAYLYLKTYPPYQWAVLDPAKPAPAPAQEATNNAISFGRNIESAQPSAREVAEMKIAVLPLAAEIFVVLLLAGGMVYTVLEVRRIAARSGGKLVVIAAALALQPTDETVLGEPGIGTRRSDSHSLENITVLSNDGYEQEKPHSWRDDEHRRFESSWLARRLEREDSVA